MSHTINRHHRYYLFWIYLLILIGLAVFAAMADRHDVKSITYHNAHFSPKASKPSGTKTDISEGFPEKAK